MGDDARTSQPPTQRGRNRARLLELVLTHGRLTRIDLAKRSGLSKASVARLTEMLVEEGTLSEDSDRATVGRGRPAVTLTPSPGLGHVIGVDMGSGTVRAIVSDLSGREAGRLECETAAHLNPNDLGIWLADQVQHTANAARIDISRVQQISVAVPSKVDDEFALIRPAAAVAHLAGPVLYSSFSERFSCPVTFANDAQMALRGEMLPGGTVPPEGAVLVISSNGLGAAAAVHHAIVPGSSGVLGELGLIPLGETNVWDGMSLHGLSRRAAHLGVSVDHPIDLLDPANPSLRQLHDEARRALLMIITVITVCLDPPCIVFTGRMLPLLAHLLPELEADLVERLPVPPAIHLLPSDGFLATRGCVDHALRCAHATLIGAQVAGSHHPHIVTAAAGGS